MEKNVSLSLQFRVSKCILNFCESSFLSIGKKQFLLYLGLLALGLFGIAIRLRLSCGVSKKITMKGEVDFLKKERLWIWRLVVYCTFGIYSILLIAILFRSRLTERSVNLIPFHSICEYLFSSGFVHKFMLENLLGNIVIFFPLGIYLNLFLHNIKPLKSMLIILSITVLAETAQVIFKFGYGDIDDVLLNCLGGFFGILFCKCLYSLCHDENKMWRLIAILAPSGAILSFALLLLHSNGFF